MTRYWWWLYGKLRWERPKSEKGERCCEMVSDRDDRPHILIPTHECSDQLRIPIGWVNQRDR